MRRRSTWLPLALSALAHAAALLGLLVAHRDPDRAPRRAETPPGELAPATPPPPTTIEVALLHADQPIAAAEPTGQVTVAPAAASTIPAKPAARPSRPSSGAHLGATPPTAGVDTGAPTHPRESVPGTLAPPTPPPNLDPRSIARTVVPELGPAPPSPLELPQIGPPHPPRSEIHPDGTGAYGADDLTFHADISRDGRVAFNDKPNFHAHVALPRPRDIKQHLENWYKDPIGVSEADQRAVQTHTVTIISGGFDLTDWAVRKGGGDPYYARKKNFLDRTRKERAEMAVSAQHENLRDAVAFLRGRLDKLWRDRRMTAAERRATLFALWDECAEEGSHDVVAAADAARATIEAFIRRRLPKNSDNAFSDGELAELNRGRLSKRRFSPYRGSTENRKPGGEPPQVASPPHAP